MSFQYVPGLIRTPRNPSLEPPEAVWCGKGSDSGYFAFYSGGYWGRYVMVKDGDFTPHLLVDEREYRPVYTDINGYIYWEGSSYIYYTQTWGWVMCSVFPGYEPVETSEYDSETGETTYGGDDFYVLSYLPYREGEAVRMTPRGRLRNKEMKSLKMGWNRWECDTEFGKYEPKGDAEGTRVLGLPRFRGNGEYFVRSLTKTNYHYTYGRIHYSLGKWVIGEVGSANGWHEGSEPNADGGSVTFKFCIPEGSEVKGSDITVSFVDYVMGEETETGYLGEVAIWR